MPRTVQDIMNRELLAIRPDLSVREARELLRSFQVGAAPVLDEARRPVGVVSIRDLFDGDGLGETAQERMSRPALCVTISATVEQAARQLASTDMHHLVVVDGTGAAVGMLSTLDALRALLDLPARHPKTFPHWDPDTCVSWTDDAPLDTESSRHVFEGAGVLMLRAGRLGERDAVIWVESSGNLRERVRRLSFRLEVEEPALKRALSIPGIRFRAAAVSDEAKRSEIVLLLRQRIEHTPAPGTT
jgi:CBS domain-containing protein